MKTLIKNGRIVTAVDDYRADILIEDGNDFGYLQRRALRQRHSDGNDAQFD
ncbi:MAG: hypothetical protein LH614_20280 [Pyrinomonadaceae bacterium]|nr:hypothetical protein [Pyrinomonadaceae bacterium]